MLAPKVDEIKRNYSIGKWFVSGFLVGKSVEMLSGKRSSYGSYLGLKAAIVGTCLCVAGKIYRKINK